MAVRRQMVNRVKFFLLHDLLNCRNDLFETDIFRNRRIQFDGSLLSCINPFSKTDFRKKKKLML